MTLQNLSLFQAMGAKLNYLDQRQKVIAQNIANADTPNYRPKDLTDVERLISTKCANAANNLTSTIIDPPRVIYDTLLRLARKVMAVNLVVNNQKMVYVPVKSLAP